jgi:murein DD-endopeptidase MepM/ murein hydrolase activator NlpD
MISARLTAIGVVASLSWMGTGVHSQGERPLQVSLAPASIRPGDVVRVEIAGAGRDEALTASFSGQDLAFEFDEHDRAWRALLGVDLETEPGEYELVIRRNGDAMPATHALRIVPRTFGVRRLRVSRRFVEPPPETLERIARESRMLADTYARASARQWTGPFRLPLSGKPSSNFGTRSYYNGEPRSPHAGVDFRGATGTPIRAVNRGTIALAEPLYFTGNTVVIDHGARLFSIFAHLSEFRVAAGEVVEPDAIVGLVGATGRVTGPHLHWSVRLNDARVDPLSLVAATAE